MIIHTTVTRRILIKCARHPWTVHTLGLLFMKTFSWRLNVGKPKTEQKLIFLPCLYSPPYLSCREVGTLSHLAKFLNWGDHVNSVPDLAARTPPPLTRGIYFLIHVHNYTKIQSLDLEKITSCQNVFSLHASFHSSPKINRMFITRLICIHSKSSWFLSLVSMDSVRNAWEPPFCNEPTKKWLQFRGRKEKKEA